MFVFIWARRALDFRTSTLPEAHMEIASQMTREISDVEDGNEAAEAPKWPEWAVGVNRLRFWVGPTSRSCASAFPHMPKGFGLQSSPALGARRLVIVAGQLSVGGKLGLDKDAPALLSFDRWTAWDMCRRGWESLKSRSISKQWSLGLMIVYFLC